MVNEAVTTE